MTATDELRRLLDERGVEWVASGTDTCWTSADGYPMRAWDTTNGTHMRVADLTPEQAVEATLGRGTCHVERMPKDQNLRCRSWLACSECGWGLPTLMPANYCPNCGRKVVDA